MGKAPLINGLNNGRVKRKKVKRSKGGLSPSFFYVK